MESFAPVRGDRRVMGREKSATKGAGGEERCRGAPGRQGGGNRMGGDVSLCCLHGQGKDSGLRLFLNVFSLSAP